MNTVIDLEILGSTILFGIVISHFETRSGDVELNPSFEISIGFIFFRIILSRYRI